MDIFSYLLGKKSSGGGGGGSELDWTEIGYTSDPGLTQNDFNYSKSKYQDWTPGKKFLEDQNLVYVPLIDTSNLTSLSSFFQDCRLLRYVPKLNTSNCTNFSQMFYYCTSLKTAPSIDTSKGTNFSSMFMGCSYLENVPVYNFSLGTSFYSMFNNVNALTDQSLDNILKSCITAVNYTGTKKLTQLGLSKVLYPQEKIESLPSYQAFLNAGWTTGY